MVTTPTRLVAPKLTKLYLGGNQIASLNFGGLQALQILNLRGNKIVTLDGLDQLVGLVYLNLRYVKS